jgi:hypothetical protein
MPVSVVPSRHYSHIPFGLLDFKKYHFLES